MAPSDSMSERWYSSLAPPPRMWRKSALIVDSKSGVSSNRFLTSSSRWRTAGWSSSGFLRRSARASPAANSDATTPRTDAMAKRRVRLMGGPPGPSAEGRVLERGREPERHADLEHHVVDERRVGVLLGLLGGRVGGCRPLGRLELIDEHVVADAQVDRQPLEQEEPHRGAQVGRDEDVLEAGELLVALDDLALGRADAGGEVRLPGDDVLVEDGELSVDRHVVEVEGAAPVVLVDRRQPARLARDQVERLAELRLVVLALDADGEHVGEEVIELPADRVVADDVVVHRRRDERVELRAPHLEERLPDHDDDVLPRQLGLGDLGRLDRLPGLRRRGGRVLLEAGLGALALHLDLALLHAALGAGGATRGGATRGGAALIMGWIFVPAHLDLALVGAATLLLGLFLFGLFLLGLFLLALALVLALLRLRLCGVV